jgi:hypothetical protein
MDADDVLVVELGDGAGLLAQQHAHRLLDQPLPREQELEGHHALQLGIPGAEDNAHRSPSHLLDDLEPLATRAAHPLPRPRDAQRDGYLGHLHQERIIELEVFIALALRILDGLLIL